jgi:hypothetical protein
MAFELPASGCLRLMRENALLSRASLDLGLFQHASERGEKKEVYRSRLRAGVEHIIQKSDCGEMLRQLNRQVRAD